MRRREQCLWAITLKGGDDELIGCIDLRPDNPARDVRGFWLDPRQQGQGLMTEAAQRIAALACIDPGWPHLWPTNAEANTGSVRIKEKQGARLIETIPQAYVYGEGRRTAWRLDRQDRVARFRPSAPNETRL